MRTPRDRDFARIVGGAAHSAKLCAPRSAASLVERLPLVHVIDRGLERKLVLLLAPLGSGKTTLLNQWASHAGAQRHIAWFLCDERDNDPARFFACLAASIARAQSGEMHARLQPSGRGTPRVQYSAEHIAAVLLDRLSESEQDLTIVIDDLQWITDAAVNRAFASLLLHSAPNVHWLVASRHVPHFDLGRLKLEEQLTLIGSTELNFRPEDVRDLARLMHSEELSLADAAECCRRTEGWIAGVKLALLSAGEGGVAGVRSFSFANHDVVAYLAEAVLAGQPDGMREFLLGSCIVDRMSAELCNALLGIANSAALLQGLQRSQLFIQPLDAEHRWFRYHALFLEFLRDRLQRDAPERIASLHRAASLWFAEHGHVEEALHHAFATADRSWCLELIRRCVPEWLRAGEFAEALQWTARLTADEVMGCPRLRTAHLMSLIFSRQFERARSAMQVAEQLAAAAAPPDAESRRTLQVLELLLAVMTDADIALTMQQVEALSIVGDPYLTANLFNVSAYHMFVNRKFDAARRLALRGQQLLAGTDHVYTLAQSAIVLVLIDRAEGHAKEAADSCMRLYARTKDGRRNPIWVTAATAAASVHYHQNRLECAEALCTEVLPLLTIAPSMENFTVAHVTAARLKCAAGRHGEALRLLDCLHSVLESIGYRRLLALVCFEKVRAWLRQDRPARAMQVLADFGQASRFDVIDADEGDVPEEFPLSRIAMLMHRGAYAQAAAMLQPLCRRAQADCYVYGHIRVQAALATCYWHAQEEDVAFDLLSDAFALTEHRGFSRAVFDDVPGLPLLFSSAIKRGRLAALPSAEYFRKFQDVLACDPYAQPASDAAVDSAQNPLTQRELDLLKLLSQGLTNRDISERCNITLFTTKWHLKNVFAKLGVSTRMEAVFRAQQLQLVDGQPPFAHVR